jgi:uncharacterized protein YbbC (DUF1343 family)
MLRSNHLALVAFLAAASALPAQNSPDRPRAAQVVNRVRLGIEVLLSDSIHLIRGKRVGLITNHTGRNPEGKSSADLLHAAQGVKLTALYGPEHGIRGEARAGDHIASSVDSATGVPVHSLYGETRIPTPEMLKDVDILIYDIQDVGARVYTYPWTMALAAEAAKKKFIVLDRPNPVRADVVSGGVLDPKFRSFVGQYPVALRYGLTPGELLRYLVGTKQIAADVTVVPMDGYRRSMWWNETGLRWVNPSPNIRTADAALLYTGTVMFEGTNLSEGRGTDMPFQLVGAPWLTDAGAIARELNQLRIPGVVFDSTARTIQAGYKWGGERIPMLQVVVAEREEVKPERVGLHMLRAIYKRHAPHFQWRLPQIDRLAGSERLRAAVEREGGIQELFPVLDAESARFAEAVKPFLLYR